MDLSLAQTFVQESLVDFAQYSLPECAYLTFIHEAIWPYPIAKVQLTIRPWMAELTAAVTHHLSQSVVVGWD